MRVEQAAGSLLRLGVVALVATLAATVAAPTSHAQTDAQTQPHYTFAEVRKALESVFRQEPYEVGVTGARTLGFDPTLHRHYAVTFFIYTTSASAGSIWRFSRREWRYIGYAGMRLENVIVLASPPTAKIGKKGKPFKMPAAVTHVIRMLVEGHQRHSTDP